MCLENKWPKAVASETRLLTVLDILNALTLEESCESETHPKRQHKSRFRRGAGLVSVSLACCFLHLFASLSPSASSRHLWAGLSLSLLPCCPCCHLTSGIVRQTPVSSRREEIMFPLPPSHASKRVTLQLPLHVAEQFNSQGNCLTLFTVLTVYLSGHAATSPWWQATTPRKEYEYPSRVRPDRHHELMSS